MTAPTTAQMTVPAPKDVFAALWRAAEQPEEALDAIELNFRPPDLTDFAMTPNRRSTAVLCRETAFRWR
jgi:hypothetical protein